MPRKPTMYYPDFGPLLPTNGPDWRWARALEIVCLRKNASLNRDGPDIVRAVRFIRRTFKGVMGKEMRRLLKEDPDLVLAFRMANEGDPRQLELQCRVLAGESAGVIAVEMGLTKSIVETYCLMFYDVPERLKAKSYILHRVIRVPLAGPPSPETLMQMCVYFHGPHMIAGWLDFIDHRFESHDLTTVDGRMRESLELLLAAHSLGFDAETHFSLAKRLHFIGGTHPKMFRRRSVGEVISENVVGQLGETLWRSVEKQGIARKRSSKAPRSNTTRAAMSRTA